MWIQRNCILLTVTTNNNWAVPADFDSRRFFVLRVSDIKAHDDPYWIEFNALLGRESGNWKPRNPEYLGKVLHYLQQREVTSSFTHALETIWLMDQRSQTILDSQDDGLVSWLNMFLEETPNDVYLGQSDKYRFPVVQLDGQNYIIASNLWHDYRLYVKRHFPKVKPYTNERFNDKLAELGMVQEKKKKGRLMCGQSKYPGEPDHRVCIAKLLSVNDLEIAIAKYYKLLANNIKDAED
jgi:hypothetical protein